MNRLADALSPYLRQHCQNPVHWQPWDEQALAEARTLDKPILLSVGYAACHWCHVMARESFADPQTAAVMNAHFVNIKVDREERPDLDRIYQAAHYLFARRAGGWPLTMFLTPSGEPFFGGTYYPKEEVRGMPSFVFVMNKVAAAWKDKRDDIHQQNAQLMPLLKSFDDLPAHKGALADAPIVEAAAAFGKMTDDEHGGFSGAPKFPHPVETSFMMREGLFGGDKKLLDGAYRTLAKMANGGLCDHLGGGFFRYSVDERWQIPHFEKMLSDNGLLLALYADGALLWPEMARTTEGIAKWVLAQMTDGGGGFYSSMDADSEGGEGAFYVWHAEEVKPLLDDEEYQVFASAFALSAPPNFEGKHWHLAKCQSTPQTAKALGISESQCQSALQSASVKLLAHRQKRAHPAIDDKILTGWNALMIRGLARAGRLAGNSQWHDAAMKALDNIIKNLRHNGRLHSARRGEMLGRMAFLDDGAFLLAAVLELLRAEVSAELLTFAEDLAAEMLGQFADAESGGFYFQARDDEKLIRRPKPVDDNATPSGNGVLCLALLELSRIGGKQQWHTAAENALHTLHGAVCSRPAGCASMLAALRAYLSPPPLVLLTGDNAKCRKWQGDIAAVFLSELPVYILPADIQTLPPHLQKTPPPDADICAYLCDEHSCRPPITTFGELKDALHDCMHCESQNNNKNNNK
ncbi:MAG: thioredoxin domain-containing protein [Gammaproteobacteria bacterium]